MASISSLGVGSGLDLRGLLNQLDTAERLKLQPLTQQKAVNQSKISAYARLQGVLGSLQSATSKLNDAKTFQGQTSKISGSGVAVATSADAVPGTYQVKVTQLAQAQSVATAGVASKTAALGEGLLSIKVGTGDPLEVTLDSSNNTLEGIRDAINAKKGGVTASIVNDGTATPYRLVLSSDKTGTASTMAIDFDDGGTGGDQLNGLLNAHVEGSNAGGYKQTVEAKNAELEVSGIAVSSQTNTVEGALQGVTLTVSATGDTQTLTVERDTAAMRSAITGFVDVYNTLVGTMSSLASFNSETKVAGELLGDSALRSVQGRLRSVMSAGGEGGTYKALSDIGISLQLDGKLKIDSDKLDKAVKGDAAALSTFFAGAGGSSVENDGLAGKLVSSLKDMLSGDGALTKGVEGLKERNKGLDERYTRMESSINSTIERYRKQFAQLDSLIANMNSTSSYITQQFDALNAQLGNR